MRESPIVSVVMSVFNGQSFLAEAVESILGQTFHDLEFVVIDDGSIDRTAEILARYASQDERMRVHRHENKGRAASLNIGIGFARAKYIARMDADDVALPSRLQKQIEFMECNPNVGVLGGAYESINTRGHVIDHVQPPLQDSEIRTSMLSHNPICHPTVLMRKDVILASGGYRPALLDADDYDLFLRMGERCQLANLAEPILQYRFHANQVSLQNMAHQTMCVLAARTAASLRRSGCADPLSEMTEVTPQLLDRLGVPTDEVHHTLVRGYSHWIGILAQSNPQASLRAIDALLLVSRSGYVERQVLADALWQAAGIHYRNGCLLQACLSAQRAIFVSPVVSRRLVKWASKRLIAAFRNKPEHTEP
jgi:hypothetical protein